MNTQKILFASLILAVASTICTFSVFESNNLSQRTQQSETRGQVALRTIQQKQDFLVFLRNTLDNYLNGDDRNISELAKKHLNLYDQEYYKSKFFVFDATVMPGGFINLYIIFLEMPDRYFLATIKYEDAKYDLLDFSSILQPSEELTNQFKEEFSSLSDEQRKLVVR